MTTVAHPVNRLPNTSDQDRGLQKFLLYSAALHAFLFIGIAVSAVFHINGNQWAGTGGGGDNVKVNLVSSAGIPMPKAPVVTESQVVDPTKGLYKEEPVKPPPPPPDATKLPKFEKEKPPPPTRPSKTFDRKTPPPDNAVLYGKGGNPNLPTGYSQTPGSAAGGVAVQGQGGGDFASRYGWYIEAVKRRIGSNWQQNTIDSGVLAARTAHSVAQFTIYKNGAVKDVHITQTSGNQSMDNSGLRALLSSDPMPPLPNDYSGSYVIVTFDFDLGMTR